MFESKLCNEMRLRIVHVNVLFSVYFKKMRSFGSLGRRVKIRDGGEGKGAVSLKKNGQNDFRF